MFVELKKWYEMGNLFFLEDTDILGESLLKSGFQIHFSSVSLVIGKANPSYGLPSLLLS